MSGVHGEYSICKAATSTSFPQDNNKLNPRLRQADLLVGQYYLADLAQRLRIAFRDPDVFELSLLAQLFQSPITLLQRTDYESVLLDEDRPLTSLTL